jgi:glycosyltransferase involved in cell wall biosynthesis
VIKEALKIKSDLYHLHDPELIPAGFILKILGKRVVYDAHENLSAAMVTKQYLKPLFVRKTVAKLVGVVEHLLSRSFDGIVTARPDITKTFTHPKICTLRNFPKLEDLSITAEVEKINKVKFSVIYVGGITRIRGIIELINAFEILDNAELWLLGPFVESGFFEECKSLPGWINVRYLGEVKAFEIFGFLNQADAGIVTFLPAPNHMTTLATKPFEYMAVGLPIVMSNFQYWKEFFGDNSLYVDPTSSESIAKTISELVNNPDLCEAMGRANKKLIYAEYNWENESEKLVDFYREILSV